MYDIGYGFDQVSQELSRRHLTGFGMQLRIGELGCPVDCHEEVELAFGRLDLGDIDMEVADRVALELPLRGLVTFDIWQAADAVALQAAVQGRARQVRDRRLKRVEADVLA